MNKIVLFKDSPQLQAKYIELKGKIPYYYTFEGKKTDLITNFFDGFVVDTDLGESTSLDVIYLHIPEMPNHDPLLLQALEEINSKDYTVYETEESEYFIAGEQILTPKTISWTWISKN